MKRLLLVLISILAVSAIYAQRGRVAAASAFLDNGDIESARSRLQDAFEHDRTREWPRTYIVAARLATEEYNRTNDKAKILQAVEHYKLAADLDQRDEQGGRRARPGRFERDLKVALTFFVPELQNAGIDAFNEEDFATAMKIFRSVVNLNNLSIFEEDNLPPDSVFIYYTGLAASRSQNWDVAEEFFKKTLDLRYGEGDPILLLHEIYEQTGDSAKMGPNLKRGFELFPDDDRILTSLINFYLLSEQNEQALEYLNTAIDGDPENFSFYNARGVLYDMSGEYELAEVEYRKAIELNPEFFDPLLNLGVIYFNRAIDMMREANEISDFAKFEIARNEALDVFRKSLPYMERAHEVRPEERMVLETLRNLYYRFEMMDKYDEVEQKLKALEE
ncbi:tetratricopeptide repeat protein [Natronoflexus pectinivorans]|uniref:TPR repeat protein n=1 Tax=Natronoflexus pectinivorans TaxID=682526 RepID=A0A4R2GLQ8_9BACT|nr:tetratricopeptide repeat protein [Natronoflexus pectinivorans]TCO09248.1 TPR repeat protein [Natronoflexus pectinivorans]